MYNENQDTTKNNIIDVNFTDIDEELKQYSQHIHLKTSDVGKLLGEKDSTIRYWCEEFKNVLHIERDGNNRKFSEENIKTLRNIQYILREKHWSINQVKEYLGNKNLSTMQQKVEKEHDPLAIQALASALTIEIGSQLEDFKTQLTQQITSEISNQLLIQNEMQQQNKENIKEYIAVTIDELVTEKLNSSLTEFKSYLDTKEQQATKRDTEMLTTLRQHMEERKEIQSQLEQEKKSIWSRIFGK